MNRSDAAESQSGGGAAARDQSESPSLRRKHLKNRIVTCLDDKLIVVSHGEPVNSSSPVRRPSGPLKNWKHEEFARLVAAGTEPQQAYTVAGFTPNRANHNRLIRHPPVKARIEVLRCERETAARAARVPISQVIEELDRRGIVRIEDLFERNAAGIVAVRNLEMVPVEVSLAFLKALGEGFGIREK